MPTLIKIVGVDVRGGESDRRADSGVALSRVERRSITSAGFLMNEAAGY